MCQKDANIQKDLKGAMEKYGMDFSIEAIHKYAESQNVMPYIVIGRLQKEKYLD